MDDACYGGEAAVGMSLIRHRNYSIGLYLMLTLRLCMYDIYTNSSSTEADYNSVCLLHPLDLYLG